MCVAPDWKDKPELWKIRKKRGKEGQYKWLRRKDTRQYICYSATYIGGRQLTPQLGTGSQYIGITCQGLNRRKSLHINQAKRGAGSVFHEVLREWGYENFEWKIEGEGEKLEIQRLESRLIGERCTVFPSGFNAKEEHTEEYAQWDAWMEKLESDPGYKQFEKEMLAIKQDIPLHELEDYEVDGRTFTLVKREL